MSPSGMPLGENGFIHFEVMATPSWNGKALEQVYPWGTIRTPTPEANAATGRELSAAEAEEIRARTAPLLKAFGYDGP